MFCSYEWILVLAVLIAVVAVFWWLRYGRYRSATPTPECTATESTIASNDTDFSPADLELPFFDDDRYVINHPEARYTLMYDPARRQAVWVAYLLTRAEVRLKVAERSNRFVPDPEVRRRGWTSAVSADYTSTGYDRGHLLPSADRDDSSRENNQTFYMSNISPQTPALNRRVWKGLEEMVRRWAEKYDSVWVVTAGIASDTCQTIADSMAVPESFYKALLTRYDGDYHAIGFIMPNSFDIAGSWRDYVVTVDSVEQVTGLDLFFRLPDAVEQRVESHTERDFWQ